MLPNQTTPSESLAIAIANDLRAYGYSIQEKALPEAMVAALRQSMTSEGVSDFKPAGVGRGGGHRQERSIRGDHIAWIEPTDPAKEQWLDWAASLQVELNRRLLLGLFSFESHFAHYAPGAFYKTHLDAFKGQANRVLSVVTYLNQDWREEFGGELILYEPDNADKALVRVPPLAGTLVVFLSEEFPHEVRPSTVDRYSIAGWYRCNSSVLGVVDPPA
ncbi:2OG-Fe(II) oxygenase [Limnobacter sp.]|uniref:2OG-Fe(II) oxygenase n=1 Tax=Limnobacter sp. TaxID=2003368 RepID=UPI003514B7FC